jgi:hypothetical protein
LAPSIPDEARDIRSAIELDLLAAAADDPLGEAPPRQSGIVTSLFVKRYVSSSIAEGFTMDEPRNTKIRRRELLLAVSVAGVAAAASATSIGSSRSDAVVRRDKRKPQYQANSPEVQTFYRVNRYPGK